MEIKKLNEKLEKLTEQTNLPTRGKMIEVELIDSDLEPECEKLAEIISKVMPKGLGKFMYVRTIGTADLYFTKCGSFEDPYWAIVENGQAKRLGPTTLAKLLAKD